MIDYLIVIYKNYELMYLQSDNFNRLAEQTCYNLIFVDNTPEDCRQEIDFKRLTTNCRVVINDEPDHSHDGASQGSAIDFGRKYCTSDIVCVMDSDFFITNSKFVDFDYVYNIFQTKKIQALGTEYYDGEPTIAQSWKAIREHHEEKFTNIPCCFCVFVDKDILNCSTWKVTADESSNGRSSSFIETGWRIRKYILDNKINTKTFLGSQPSDAQGTELPTYFKYESDLVGFHYQRGSHRNMAISSIMIPEVLKNNS